MADFLIPETQQPIIAIILIIYSSHFLRDLVEYISGRTAIIIPVSMQATSMQLFPAGLLLECAFVYAPRPLIDQAPTKMMQLL